MLAQYVDVVFKHFGTFVGATSDLNETEVKAKFAEMLEYYLDIYPDFFLPNVNSYERITRKTWKYLARRGISGTPRYFVNGVELSMGKYDLWAWSNFLDEALIEMRDSINK